MANKSKSSIKIEVTETSGADIHATMPEVLEPPATEEKKMSEDTMIATSTRKIDKVEYSVSFPNPEKVTLSADQTAKAVKSFFTVRTAYLLRQDVKNESAILETNRKLLAAMEAMGQKLGAEPERAHVAAMEYLQSQDANFRIETTLKYSYTLDQIFAEEKSSDEDKPETEEKPAE